MPEGYRRSFGFAQDDKFFWGRLRRFYGHPQNAIGSIFNSYGFT